MTDENMIPGWPKEMIVREIVFADNGTIEEVLVMHDPVSDRSVQQVAANSDVIHSKDVLRESKHKIPEKTTTITEKLESQIDDNNQGKSGDLKSYLEFQTCSNQSEQKSLDLSNQESSRLREKRYSCYHCGYRAPRLGALRIHVKTHTNESPRAVNVPFIKVGGFTTPKKHKMTHSDEKPFTFNKCNPGIGWLKPYSCDKCDFKTRTLGHLEQHSRSHREEKPDAGDKRGSDRATERGGAKKLQRKNRVGKPYACEVCSYRTRTAGELKRHEMIHTGEKPYSCGLCDFKARQSAHLKYHMMTHVEHKLHGCTKCEFRTKHETYLKYHNMRKHTGEKPFTCRRCDFSTSGRSNLARHMRIHTAQKSYSCDECDFRTRHQGYLKFHMRIHTDEKAYTCHFCGFRARIKSQLKLHMSIHTGEKPYPCDVCDYRARIKQNLTVHMRSHTGERPYTCHFCGYKALIKHHLTIHLRVHTGEKPYSCHICGYKVTTKEGIKRHVRIHTLKP